MRTNVLTIKPGVYTDILTAKGQRRIQCGRIEDPPVAGKITELEQLSEGLCSISGIGNLAADTRPALRGRHLIAPSRRQGRTRALCTSNLVLYSFRDCYPFPSCLPQPDRDDASRQDP